MSGSGQGSSKQSGTAGLVGLIARAEKGLGEMNKNTAKHMRKIIGPNGKLRGFSNIDAVQQALIGNKNIKTSSEVEELLQRVAKQRNLDLSKRMATVPRR
jgi:hypothetical protein